MVNTSIIHCGRGRERMEVDFYAKLDWQLSLCPLYLRWVGVRGTSSYRLAGSKQSWHVCNQGILDQFNLRWHFTYNWGEIRDFLESIFHEVKAGWHFCWLGQNAIQKLQSLIWFFTGGQARPSSPNVTVSQLVEITSATSNTQWNTQNIQWNTQNTQKSTTEMSQWSVMSWNANQISIIAEIPVRDEDFVFKFNLVLDI